MKRSTINQHLKRAGEFFDKHNFVLPPWADWTLEDWRSSKDDNRAVFQGGLGWDLTDFGSGAYDVRGLMLFTLRNGNPMEPTKTYAEKIMMVEEGQETPRHFHLGQDRRHHQPRGRRFDYRALELRPGRGVPGILR
jgi:D-lyxose ketol-isomerase